MMRRHARRIQRVMKYSSWNQLRIQYKYNIKCICIRIYLLLSFCPLHCVRVVRFVYLSVDVVRSFVHSSVPAIHSLFVWYVVTPNKLFLAWRWGGVGGSSTTALRSWYYSHARVFTHFRNSRYLSKDRFT